MREVMPETAIDPTLARDYAGGELSFEDIAIDRGPRRCTTLDKGTSLPRRARAAREEAVEDAWEDELDV